MPMTNTSMLEVATTIGQTTTIGAETGQTMPDAVAVVEIVVIPAANYGAWTQCVSAVVET